MAKIKMGKGSLTYDPEVISHEEAKEIASMNCETHKTTMWVDGKCQLCEAAKVNELKMNIKIIADAHLEAIKLCNTAQDRVNDLKEALQKIREMGNNEDEAAQAMQEIAAVVLKEE